MDLPTIELIEGRLYWIKEPHRGSPDLWTIGRWEHGCWRNLKNEETTPSVVSGPIPPPAGEA
jgi:hypothetical protein